ncbi:MAG: hypothetical protein AAFU85_18445 [Planctomycetota bacterium]
MNRSRKLSLILTCCVLFVFGCNSKPPANVETVAERNNSIKMAFTEESSPEASETDARATVPAIEKTVVTDDSRYRPGAEELMGRLRLAFSQENGSQLAELIDAETMVRTAIEMGVIPSKFGRGTDGQAFTRGFRQGVAQSLAASGTLMKWDDTRITRIEALDADRMVVYVKLWDDEMESYSKLRWWLSRSASQWRLYDFEDFDMNIQMSTMMGIGIAAQSEGRNGWAASLMRVLAFMQNQGSASEMILSIDELEPEFESILAAENVPPKIKSLAHFFKASILILNEQWESALREIETAQSIEAGLPVHFYMKTVVLSGLEQYEEARAALDAYAAMLGWDADTCMLAARIAYDSGDAATARDYALRGLEDQPGSFYNLEYYGLALPDNEKGKIEEYFVKLSDSELGFEYLMDAFLEQDDDAAMDALMAIQRKHNPESDLIEYYEEEMSN